MSLPIDRDGALMLSGAMGTILEVRRSLDTRRDPKVAEYLERAEKALAGAMARLLPSTEDWDELARLARQAKVKVVLLTGDDNGGGMDDAGGTAADAATGLS